MIFCQPRQNYHSYTDFWRLIELSGYELIYIDEIDITKDECYIVTTPDINHSWKTGKAKIIFWLLEWYDDYYTHPGVTETWCSNQTFAEQIDVRYVPMGSHAGLGEKRAGDTYDIAHMSYDAIHRRSLILNKLRENGVTIAPNGWGSERHVTLLNTRAMLHIHQSNRYPAIAPLRASLAAAYALPFISENGWSVEPYNDTIITHEYDSLHEVIPAILSSADLGYYGQALHDKLCDKYRFDKVVEAHV